MAAAVAAALHFLALGIGLGSVFARGRAMRAPFDKTKLDALFLADNWYGIAALLWIGSGLWRLLGGVEKGSDWYLGNPLFHAKLGLYGVAACLEMWPMITFIRWRVAQKRGTDPDLSAVRYFRVINAAEVGVVVLMVFTASAMARGIGYTPKLKQNLSPACAVEEVLATQCKACHNPTTLLAGMDMSGGARKVLVDTPSSQWPLETRVVPGHPESSLVMKKLRGKQGELGGSMPPGGKLPDATLDAFERWIADGAPACEP